MILFAGIPSEAPVRLAIAAARRLGLPTAVLDQRRMHVDDLRIDVGPGGLDGAITVEGRVHDLASLSGVYVRLMDVPTLPGFAPGRRRGVTAALAMHRAQAFQDILLDWLEVTPCRVASRPSAMTSNNSKPYQAQLIERFGLATPPTLVTNDPQAVRAFAAEHRHLVYKSVSGTRSIVRRLDAGAMRRLERVRALPTQFQAYVAGVDIRVHVAGTDVHATEVLSDAVDYRYAARDGATARLRSHALGADVAARCVDVAWALDLPFCGLDLRRTPSGDHVCFEVNPMPAYAYYQQETGQAIADSLVRYLGGAEGEESRGVRHRELVAHRGQGARSPA